MVAEIDVVDVQKKNKKTKIRIICGFPGTLNPAEPEMSFDNNLVKVITGPRRADKSFSP